MLRPPRDLMGRHEPAEQILLCGTRPDVGHALSGFCSRSTSCSRTEFKGQTLFVTCPLLRRRARRPFTFQEGRMSFYSSQASPFSSACLVSPIWHSLKNESLNCQYMTGTWHMHAELCPDWQICCMPSKLTVASAATS